MSSSRSNNLKEMIINNPKAQERIQMKRIDHDVKKEMKGFCSDPFCWYCERKI